MHKNITNIYHKNVPLIYQYYLDRNFLCSNKKFNLIKDEKFLIEIKKIIKELFVINGNKNENYYIEKIINLFEKENKFNNITIMEILIFIYLDNDINNVNMNDILYNLYNFTMFSNKNNICTISNLVELVYIIYKKYSIFYEYKQIKNMVNYYFQKEKYSTIKNVFIYKIRNIEEISNSKEIHYYDITSKFLFYYNNFSEICDKFIYYNKSDLNPQSKNNVILILKIILYELFIQTEENKNKKEKNDLLELGFIGIEYCKEYTNEKLFFYFNYNSDKNDYNVEFRDIYNRYGYDLKDYTEKNEENIYELILLYANNNFLFNNKNNNYLKYNISFKDFKNIFVNLPYLNDILFNNIYKIFSKSNTKLISNKNFKYDKICVYIINESQKIFEVIFVSNSKNKNYLYNSNFTRIYNSIIINYNIFTNFNIKKLYDIIINNIKYKDLKNLIIQKNDDSYFELIKKAISDFNKILFYTMDENKNKKYMEPLLPLYINFSNNNKSVIDFYLDISYSFFLKKNKIKSFKGYCKFPQNKENNIFQWRKCYIFKRSNEQNYKIIFKCFKKFHKTEKNLKDLFKNDINNKNDEDENKDRKIITNFDDTVIINEKFIKDNLLIVPSFS